MSLRFLKLTAVPFFLGLVSVVLFLNLSAAAQDEVPQYDLFIGYQWLHPGATVASFKNPLNPVPRNLEEMPIGAGGAFAWNFSPHWALEGDVGGNGKDNDFLTTFSAGPRLMLRQEDSDIFIHDLVTTSPDGAAGFCGPLEPEPRQISTPDK